MRISFDVEEADHYGASLNIYFENEKEIPVHTCHDFVEDGKYIMQLTFKENYNLYDEDTLVFFLEEWQKEENFPEGFVDICWMEVSKVWMIEMILPLHDD